MSEQRAVIARAIEECPVVIVCGETGSGKTTQLPKIAWTAGRGRTGLIGHTQPRRLAASSVAKRIAEELQSPLGQYVGYKVRFNERLTPTSTIKLMTDGILLAETQADPDLKAYDTLIIDEAHERSLNIDFLLGYLRELLARRPDLKLIITSATIDADRFAKHFSSVKGPAPVIEVSGRLFPVELRYRPLGERGPGTSKPDNSARPMARTSASTEDDSAVPDTKDLNAGIVSAVDECLFEAASQPQNALADILVFLPGEREIRDAAETLRGHFQRPGARQGLRELPEVVPLFARLSPSEQEKVFKPSGRRRIILATNVAETSLTVPGIRYVVDTGLARVKRYRYRGKVEQLQVEAIAQAAARQRAGRCGRLGPGVCIRLYDEQSFLARPEFTDPEILRSSLAAVILRMKALQLTDIERFPFVDPPPRRAIVDGVALLHELQALDAAGELTPTGRVLARLPVDPKLGRMLLAGKERGCLSEALVIASALSVQDPRERPSNAQEAADRAHLRWFDPKSEFMSWIHLWRWVDALFNQRRGSKGAAGEWVHAAALEEDDVIPGGRDQRPSAHSDEPLSAMHAPKVAGQSPLSRRQLDDQLKGAFVSPLRVREWRDVHAQLLEETQALGWRENLKPADYESLHTALLTGLLGNIGVKSDENNQYLGTHEVKFGVFPGSSLAKKPPKWLMAAEQVDTGRLWARTVAAIEPAWVERVGAHLIRRSVSEPHWEKKRAQAVAWERGTLYGLTLWAQRRVAYAPIDSMLAREIFIRSALVEGDWDCELPFFKHNARARQAVEALEHKARRTDVLVDDALVFAWYDREIPSSDDELTPVFDGPSFESWYRESVQSQPELLKLKTEDLMRHEAAGVTSDAFPKVLTHKGAQFALDYHFEPRHPRDGVTVSVPLHWLNQLDEHLCDWLVPGMLKEKVQFLLKSLPGRLRRHVVPIPQWADTFVQNHTRDGAECHLISPLVEAIARAIRQQNGAPVSAADLRIETLPPHCLMNFRLVDEHGRQLAMGRSLAVLRQEWGARASEAFAREAQGALASALRKSGVKPGSGRPAVPEAAPSTNEAPQLPGAAAVLPGVNDEIRDWTFGVLPELMELTRKGQVLLGYPALVDRHTHCSIEVFDDAMAARRAHRVGLRRLFALQLKDAVKAIEKNVASARDLQLRWTPFGTADDLKNKVLAKSLDRGGLNDPLPTSAADFQSRLASAKPKITLLANECMRQIQQTLDEHAAFNKKLAGVKNQRELFEDLSEWLKRLIGADFIGSIPDDKFGYLPRYLKAAQLRIDKYRADASRDSRLFAEIKQIELPFWRRWQSIDVQEDPRWLEFRWQLEELRVSVFAQELKTPAPVSVKRMHKVWLGLQAVS